MLSTLSASQQHQLLPRVIVNPDRIPSNLYLSPKSPKASISPIKATCSPKLSGRLEDIRSCFEILNVLEKYGTHTNAFPTPSSGISTHRRDSERAPWLGKFNFFPQVHAFVQNLEPIQLTLPGFPCKSVSLALISHHLSSFLSLFS
jgi:hypothetical protein